jgi:hypothetical protein
MPPKLLDPSDFVVTDPFGRTLRFYVGRGKFYRRDETPELVADDGPDVKEVSKIVYALQWLDVCLNAGLFYVSVRE